jgi:hypothetical protein
MSTITYLFTPNHARYEGVRPINVHLLRLFYFLMAAFIATQSWSTILTHQGPWDHVRAVAWCVWAAYTTMSVLGLVHPLRMLPIFVFMIFYKTLWLVVVALPLWRAGQLTGPVAEMARVFIGAPLLTLVVPWGYFFRQYVLPAERVHASEASTRRALNFGG